ncbi:peptidoglycan-binding domain-containing protein [Neolewinella sp.]|uniref:peptidoglycan-binding domain-containing protein n=1 Tax=Neolewinella sp. TaxID=2993543 RepID=UPI003B518DBF
MNCPRATLTASLILLSCWLPAQELYNVRVGTFQDADAADFADLRELGFIYGLAREAPLVEVYVGNYSTQEKATQVSEQLQTRGYRNAAPFALPTTGDASSTYVQIALRRGRDRELDWPALERAGKLYVDATDGAVKVVTGPYASPEDATQALSDIRGLGYADAFIKKLNPQSLIPVGVFETGIKKPLIPLELRQPPVDSEGVAPAPAPRATDTVPAAPPTAPDSAPLGEEAVAAAAEPPATVPVPQPLRVDRPGLPDIDMRTKRHSAAELQRVLKEKGYYDGAIDGLYGPGTTAAYEQAWAQLAPLRKYRILAAAEGDGAAPGNAPASWPEVTVALAIADDLAAGLDNAQAAQKLQEARGALLNATAPLPTPDAARARNWETTVWQNLDEWATEDPLHAQLLTALRVAYYQSQVRLEAMYQQRGMDAIAARDLATASLQNMLSAQLDRFL